MSHDEIRGDEAGESTEELDRTDPQEGQEGGHVVSTEAPSISGGLVVPPGLKLVPESYIAVEPGMYRMMMEALRRPSAAAPAGPIQVTLPRPPEEVPKPVFQIQILRQLHLGSCGYNVVPGQELTYCPADKNIQIDGEKIETIQSFLSHWKLQFGDQRQRDPAVVQNPFFLILNPESCPPIEESLGRTIPKGRFANEGQRILHEDRRWDATRRHSTSEGGRSSDGPGPHGAALPSAQDLEYDPHSREYASRGQRAERFRQMAPQSQYQPNPQVTSQEVPPSFIMPQDPQAAMHQAMANRNFPTMPPRGGVRGPDGLTARGRRIATLSADAIERPVQRQTVHPVAGYEAPETIADFPVEQGQMAGGQIVGQIPGGPADEAYVIAQQLDLQAQQLGGGRSRYGV